MQLNCTTVSLCAVCRRSKILRTDRDTVWEGDSGELKDYCWPSLVKANSITLAGSELAPNRFGASSELVRS